MSTFQKRADASFSLFIRLRDSEDEFCSCISCGGIQHFTEMDCGHYRKRSHLNTRYDERNCNAQCKNCNEFMDGNEKKYEKGLIKKYGEHIINELKLLSLIEKHIGVYEYIILIKMYKEKARNL